jgi:hypothetical protein
MKEAIFWDVTPCGSCENTSFGGMYCLHHQGKKNADVSSSLALFTLMMETIRSSEMSFLTRATRRHIPEDDIL